MSFRFTFGQDVSEYFQNVFDNSQSPPDDTGSATGLGHPIGYGANSRVGNLIYHIGRDRFFCAGRVSSAAPDGPTGVCFFDPNFFAESPPNSDFTNQTNLGLGLVAEMQIDQFDPDTSAQRMFLANAGLGNVDELDPIALTLTPDVFNGPNGIFSNSISDIGTGGVDGAWATLSAHQLYFTGLKNGIRVETGGEPNANGHLNNIETLASGTNVYPDGLVLMQLNTGQLEGNDLRFSFGWIDLRTRRLVGLLGAGLNGLSSGTGEFFPSEVDSSPTGNNSEADIGGDTFDWVPTQYLPDDDATFAEPKGELVFIPRLEIPGIAGVAAPGDVQRVYIRVTDFNPFNKAAAAGSRERQHGRKRLTSRVIVELNPMFDLAGQDPVTNPANPSVQFDPLRSRWVCLLHSAVTDPFPIATNYQTVGFFSRQVDPTIITSPAARDVPRTNDVVEFETFCAGDLGEPCGGITIDWTLDRRSSEGEIIDASTFPGSSTVANPPIDDVSPSIPEGTLVVESDGTPLVEGVDYTVVLLTGVITWITDQSGAAVVTATYEHRETAATPAHGSLLSSDSLSDELGSARTQVFIIDDDALVGTIDNLDASEST